MKKKGIDMGADAGLFEVKLTWVNIEFNVTDRNKTTRTLQHQTQSYTSKKDQISFLFQ